MVPTEAGTSKDLGLLRRQEQQPDVAMKSKRFTCSPLSLVAMGENCQRKQCPQKTAQFKLEKKKKCKVAI